jgi:hypothetical protein
VCSDRDPTFRQLAKAPCRYSADLARPYHLWALSIEAKIFLPLLSQASTEEAFFLISRSPLAFGARPRAKATARARSLRTLCSLGPVTVLMRQRHPRLPLLVTDATTPQASLSSHGEKQIFPPPHCFPSRLRCFAIAILCCPVHSSLRASALHR